VCTCSMCARLPSFQLCTLRAAHFFRSFARSTMYTCTLENGPRNAYA
jgi:hypothetical protein